MIHSLIDLSQDDSGMWWWACFCNAQADDAVLDALTAASGFLDHLATPESADACVVADCTYSAEANSSYCVSHGVRWGREGGCKHHWDALRSIPPSWRCRECKAITTTRPTPEFTE